MVSINSPWDLKLYNEQREKARKSINSASDAKIFYETYGGNGQLGNWNSPNRNVGKYGYAYNPATHSWEKVSSTGSIGTTQAQTTYNSSSMSNSGGGSASNGGLSQTGVVNSNDSSTSDSKTQAEKDYIEIEFNTLTGQCTVLPSKASMKLKVGDTVKMQGIGKFLSGLFFISEITRTISSDGGYTQTLNLLRNGFGDNLKKGVAKNSSSGTSNGSKDTSKNVTNKFKVGDKVKIVGDNAIYSNASDGVKVPEWVKNEELTVDALSDDGKRARLNPIFSWTYVKYLKRV